MPPGIIKDPSRSPGVIYRADALSPSGPENFPQLPATIISDETAKFEAGTKVIFKVRQMDTYDIGGKKYKIDVAVEVKQESDLTTVEDKVKWLREWAGIRPEISAYFVSTDLFREELGLPQKKK